jgi:hypothetical protein
MKPVGEPDALIGHVRFDERGWETERCQMAQATAPILDSTLTDIERQAPDVRYGWWSQWVDATLSPKRRDEVYGDVSRIFSWPQKGARFIGAFASLSVQGGSSA